MKGHRDVFKSLTLVFQFGINMIVPILLCTFAGIFLDKLFNTSFIVVILFFVGALAGFRNIFVFAKGIGSNTTHLGSDAEESVSGHKGEDIAETMDRLYKDKLNEQIKDHP